MRTQICESYSSNPYEISEALRTVLILSCRPRRFELSRVELLLEAQTFCVGVGALGKEVNLFQPTSQFLPMIDEVFKSLVETTKEIKEAKVENNKFCVSVHYRNVDEKCWMIIAKSIDRILKN